MNLWDVVPAKPGELRFITLLMLATTIAAVGLYVVKPQVLQWQQAHAQLTQLEAALASAPPINNLERLHSDVENLLFAVSAQASPVPSRQYEGYFIEQLQDVARATGVRIASIQPVNREIGTDVLRFSFKVDLAAQYGDVTRWMHAVETQVAGAAIGDVTLGIANTADPAAPTIAANMMLHSIRLVPNE